jgi:2'-deoxynucleoside 5'-phosphate N-hydrolase
MKIYFAGSIRGGRGDVRIYQSLIAFLSAFGEVLTEHVGDVSLTEVGGDGPDNPHIHARDIAWLSASDVLIAEVSTPSLGVGYELGCAASMKKPILCLYRSGTEHPLSAMIAGSPGIKTAIYNSIDEAKEILAAFLNER